MRLPFLTCLFALMCAVALPVAAQSAVAAPTASTPSADLQQWHQQITKQYQQVHYLDADGKSITAQQFLAVVAQHIVSFTMSRTQVDQNAPSMTLQLLAPAAAPAGAQ